MKCEQVSKHSRYAHNILNCLPWLGNPWVSWGFPNDSSIWCLAFSRQQNSWKHRKIAWTPPSPSNHTSFSAFC